MRTIRTLHIVNGALLVLLFGGSLWLYPALPEQIPHHFDLYGQADAYWGATLVRWMLLPVIAALTAACLYGPAWLVGPSGFNVPRQEQYEALSPAQKRHVTALVQRALYWMTTAELVILVAVQAGVYAVATTAATTLPAAVGGTIIAGLLAIGGITGWLVWGLSRRIQVLSDPDGSSEGEARPEPADL